MRVVVVLFLIALPALFGQDSAKIGDLSEAEHLYSHTDYRASLTLLREGGGSSGKAYALAGQDYYMLGNFKKASQAFERALAAEPANSEYALWLGRSYGRRAETASPLFAPKYAGKARTCFEKAVALDPNSEDALSDLFSYYLEAPGFLGGGYKKAEQIANRIAQLDPSQGHVAQAELAEKRKEFDTAEEELRWAVQVAPTKVGRLLDLAQYLARRGQIAESEAAFDQAAKIAPNSPRVDFARAQLYIEQHRNLAQAKALLNKYLQSNLTSNDPSRAQAEKLLKEVAGA